MLRLLPGISRGMSIALATVVVVGALLPVLFTVVTAELVGSVSGAVQQGFQSDAGRHLQFMLGLAALLFIAQQAIGPYTEALSESLGRRVDGHFRKVVMRSTLDPPGTAHLEDPLLLDKISIARGVGPGRFTPGRAVMGMGRVAWQYLSALLYSATLIGFNWWLAILIFAARVFLRQRARGNYLKMINVFTSRAESLRRSDYHRDLALRPEAAKETRIFQMKDWVIDRFSSSWLEVMNEAWKERKGGFTAMIPIMVGNWILLLIAYSLLAEKVLANEIDVRQVALYAMAIFQTRAISWITDADIQTEYGLAAVPAALQLDEASSSARLEGGTADAKNLPKQGVRFESVSFSYPRSESKVFSDLDLFIPAGKSLAIVGLNGAGKTTLVKLLCRFYDPTEGRITVDGLDLREFPPQQWQHRVAAIFQDFVRYQLSVTENIGFGAIEAMGQHESVVSAARMAGIDTAIEQLDSGWDTTLSRQYSGGADLSGGQWQRIALARAIFASRHNPGILVLDEPTANLDVRAEGEIYDRFFQLTRGLTTVVISHRFSTVRQADSIVVLENGRVTEQGSHHELVAIGGRYAEMFALQASRFVDESDALLEDEDT